MFEGHLLEQVEAERQIIDAETLHRDRSQFVRR